MGIPITAGSLQVTYQGKTIALDVFTNAIGAVMVVIAENQNGNWSVVDTIDSMLTVAEIQQDGGLANYITTSVSAINAGLAALFPVKPPTYTAGSIPAIQPTTDAEALAAVTAILNGGTINVPVAPIPAQMAADYAGLWTAVPVGESVPWANGSITKQAAALAVYASPDGAQILFCPASDLNAIAKANQYIASAWKAAYGFVCQ